MVEEEKAGEAAVGYANYGPGNEGKAASGESTASQGAEEQKGAAEPQHTPQPVAADEPEGNGESENWHQAGHAGDGVVNGRKAHFKGVIPYVLAAAIAAIIVYGFYNQLQYVAVQPAVLPQAGGARFYENFVYNESHLIPSSCLVFSYDPTLFIANNRSSAQLGYLYDKQEFAALSREYSCLVIDYGYWCYTPNNYCTYAKSDFVLSTIANTTYNQTGNVYSFYRIDGINASPS